jgi:hypothetical protein
MSALRQGLAFTGAWSSSEFDIVLADVTDCIDRGADAPNQRR